MNKVGLFLAAGAIFSSAAQAELVSTDWLVEGDSKATLDTKTGVEWLDLSETKGKSIAQVQALLDTTYSGWHLATKRQVFDLFANSFSFVDFDYGARNVGVSESNYAISETTNFISKFGSFRTSNAEQVNGLFLNNEVEESGVSSASAVYFWRTYYRDQKVNIGLDMTSASYTVNNNFSTLGVYLVSYGGTTLSSINDPSINLDENGAPAIASVPLTASVGFLGLALLAGARRKKQ